MNENEKIESIVMAEFIDCLENTPTRSYDFIAGKYWKMDKYELANIVKELLYAISKRVDEEDILSDVAEELKEYYAELD